MKQRLLYQDAPKGLLDGLVKTELCLKNSVLDAKLFELIRYRVSQINGCAYCLDAHHKTAIALGESELRLHSLITWRDCPFFDEKEKAILEFSEAVTLTSEREVDDQLYGKLSDLFSAQSIIEILVVITQINTWNRINKTMKLIPGNFKVGQF